MMESLGAPCAFGHYGDTDGEDGAPQAAPFIYWSYERRSDFHADGINYAHVAALTIELCTAPQPDFPLQAAIEAALTAAGLTYDQPEQDYDDGQRVTITTYNTEVLLTDG